jgi:hypothetical protein
VDTGAVFRTKPLLDWLVCPEPSHQPAPTTNYFVPFRLLMHRYCAREMA